MHSDAPHLPPPDPADAPEDGAAPDAASPARARGRSGPFLLLLRRLGVVALLLAAAVAVAGMLYASRPQVATRPPESVRPVVQTFAAQRVAVARQWTGRGTARALHSVDVPARVTAVVVGPVPPVRPGDAVTIGQPLVLLDQEDFLRGAEVARQRIREIDASLAQLDVEQKRLNEQTALDDGDVAMARTEFDRQTRLNDRGVTTGQDVDAARRILIAAQRSQLATRQAADLIGPRRRQLEAQKAGQLAQEQLAELDRQRTSITSPLAGVVQAIDVEVGESVAPGQRVARVVAMDRVEVPVALPAAAGGSVAVGDAVILRSAGASSLSPVRPQWASTVVRVAPEQDAATRTLTVYAEVTRGTDGADGAPAPPPPGVFLDASVQTADAELRWVVPRRALREGRLQVVADGRLSSRPAEVDFFLSGLRPELGVADDQWAVIDDVLAPGDRVLIDAANRLPDGTEVVDAADADTPPAGPPLPPEADGVDADADAGGTDE